MYLNAIRKIGKTFNGTVCSPNDAQQYRNNYECRYCYFVMILSLLFRDTSVANRSQFTLPLSMATFIRNSLLLISATLPPSFSNVRTVEDEAIHNF